MKSIRTNPTNGAPQGDERNRTAVTRYSAISRYESSPLTTVYFIRDPDGPVKIGHARDIVSRLRGLQAGNPRTLTVVAYFEAPRAFERHLHDVLIEHRMDGEWFADHQDVWEVLDLSIEMWGEHVCDECERASRFVMAGRPIPPAASPHTCAGSLSRSARDGAA